MRGLAFTLAFASTFAAAAARADEDPCIRAYTQAQMLRKDGRTVSARAQAAICAQASCNAILAKDCTRWLSELEAIAPSVVLDVKGPNGVELVDVRVTMDGDPLANRIDGKAIEIDPGTHVFTFESRGYASIERSILVREGEKGRRLSVVLAKGAAIPPSRPVPLGVYVFGSASVLALGVAGVFTLDGLSRKSDLDACRPRCAPDEVDAMTARFTLADVALGAGLMAGAAAIYLLLTRPVVESGGAARSAEAAAGADADQKPRIGIMPTGLEARF